MPFLYPSCINENSRNCENGGIFVTGFRQREDIYFHILTISSMLKKKKNKKKRLISNNNLTGGMTPPPVWLLAVAHVDLPPQACFQIQCHQAVIVGIAGRMELEKKKNSKLNKL